MKLEKWVALSEIAASVAVVMTLLILAVEVRNNTSAIERRAAQERTERTASPFLDSGEVPNIFAKINTVDGIGSLRRAYIDRYDLDLAESMIWIRLQMRSWRSLQNDYDYLGRSADLDRRIGILLSSPDSRLYWEHRGQLHSSGFRSYVESIRERL